MATSGRSRPPFGLRAADRIAFAVAAGRRQRRRLRRTATAPAYVGGLSLDVLSVGIDAFIVIDTEPPRRPRRVRPVRHADPAVPGHPARVRVLAHRARRPAGPQPRHRRRGAGAGPARRRRRRGAVPREPAARRRPAGRPARRVLPDPRRQHRRRPGRRDLAGACPTIITGQLGVVISLPDGVIVVLGSIEAVLPDPDAPVLELHLDTLGALDLAAGTLLIVGLALRLPPARVHRAVGRRRRVRQLASTSPTSCCRSAGFHPGFQPPAHVPGVLEDLRRMRAEVDVGLGVTALIESYFAVHLEHGAVRRRLRDRGLGRLPRVTTYTARGWFDFDVLLQFSPFLIIADASAGVGVFAGDKELIGVNLAVHLEGPEPWYASGTGPLQVLRASRSGSTSPSAATPRQSCHRRSTCSTSSRRSWPTRRRGPPSRLRASSPGCCSRATGPGTRAPRRPADRSARPSPRSSARWPGFGETTPLQSEVSVAASTSVVDAVSGRGARRPRRRRRGRLVRPGPCTT